MSSKFVQRPRSQPHPAICKKGWARRGDSSYPRRLLCSVRLLEALAGPPPPDYVEVFCLYAMNEPPALRFEGQLMTLEAQLRATLEYYPESQEQAFRLHTSLIDQDEANYFHRFPAKKPSDCEFETIELTSIEYWHSKALVSVSL